MSSALMELVKPLFKIGRRKKSKNNRYSGSQND